MIADSERRWVDSMSDAYQRWLAPVVFEPFGEELAHRVAAVQPQRLLELAAGTGVLTRCLRDVLPDAHIVATDLNEAMVAAGRQQVPHATWRQADALDLPFPDHDLDAVVCQFGVMFFPDKPRAYAEMRRVLRPAGTMFLNTWDVVASHDFAAALTTALDRVFPDDPPAFVAAIPHGYANPNLIVDEIREAGFSDVQLDTVSLTSPVALAADLAAGFCTGTPLRAEIETRADLATTVQRVAGLMQDLLGTGPVTGRMTAHVVRARSL